MPKSAVSAFLSKEAKAARTGDPRHSLADLTRARELLRYEPVVSFAEGIQRLVEAAKVKVAV